MTSQLPLAFILILSVAPFLTSCSSMTATYLGNPSENQKVEGMPIVLERPRFLKVTEREVIHQVIAFRHSENTPNSSTNSTSAGTPPPPGNQPAVNTTNSSQLSDTTTDSNRSGGIANNRILHISETIPSTIVDFETITVGEVYALDFKRPAAGTSEFEVDFGNNSQYPTKIKAKSEDKTIAEFRDTLGKLLEAAAKGAVPTSDQLKELLKPELTTKLVEVSSTVKRIWIYDLDQVGTAGYRPIQIFPAE